MAEEFTTPNKRALLIGINEYPKLPSRLQLMGCINDVEIMKRLLESSFGFSPSDVTVLLDKDATRAAILGAMEDLVKDCAPNDIVVFHYSGHGSRGPARNGDKPSGSDESILPSDTGRMNPDYPEQAKNLDITDAEIHEWLMRLAQKTRHITLLFDSCHSGSIARTRESGEEGTRLRWVPPDPLPERLSAPYPTPNGRDIDTGGSGWLPLSDKYVLLAACAANESAYELDNDDGQEKCRYGAFTFFLSQEIEQAPTHNTYLDIWEKIVLKVANKFQGKQTPQLEGARDRQLFNVQDISPMRYLVISKREGAEVQLQGGAIHGLTKLSRWEVYPAATKQVTGEENLQGVIELVSIGPRTATAVVREEKAPYLISAGARAVEIMHADEKTRMSVRLAQASGDYKQKTEELRQVLADSELLKINDIGPARVEICLLMPGDPILNSLEPTVGGLAIKPKWAVFGDSDKSLWMSPCPVQDTASGKKIRENLETIWRYEKMSELSNENSKLKGKIDFILLQKDSAGHWQEVDSRKNPDKVVYRAGDRIAFRVINRSGVPIYVSVLDFGLSKRIDVLYPPDRGGEMIGVEGRGGKLSVGEDDEAAIELYFPDHSTFISSACDGEPTSGREIFKLIATSGPHDLSFLRQTGLKRDIEQERQLQHPLERLVYLTAHGVTTRETQMKYSAQDDWVTLEQCFWLQRNN